MEFEILKRLKRVGKSIITIDGKDMLIESTRISNEEIGIWIGKSRSLVTYMKKNDNIEEIIELVKNEIETELEKMIEEEEMTKRNEEKLKNGGKLLTKSDLKSLLIKALPYWIGNTTTATTGSQYLLINGKTLRFSSHMREGNNKWNEVHGSEYIDIKDCVWTCNELIAWIEKTIENPLKETEKKKITNQFMELK